MLTSFDDKELPGLFHSADSKSIIEQKKYFNGILWYLILLIAASIISYIFGDSEISELKIVSAILFLLTLSIMIWLHVFKPDDIWYNARAVAESVKTRSWRWMMNAEPYSYKMNPELCRKNFIQDLREILNQYKTLIQELGDTISLNAPISDKMIEVRKLSLTDRLNFYKKCRITAQAEWYVDKAKMNKSKANIWFWISVTIHVIAIFMLIYNVKIPNIKFPIEILAVAASSILTWTQAKKYKELSSSYSLTAHEIILIKSEKNEIQNESEFSEYVLNCENAFSREHTQWFAKKS